MVTRAACTWACFTGTLVATSAVASCGARTGLVGEPEGPFDAGAEDELLPDRPTIFNPCPDAAATLIYAIGSSGTLYSYDPPTATFTTIGVISCPGAEGSTPFSMAVDREGVAYVEFADGEELGANLYRVSTKTASCTKTIYDTEANDRVTYGMSFVANAGDANVGGETLFIAQQPAGGDASPSDNRLATLSTSAFDVSVIGAFAPIVEDAELAGTGDGTLFAFFSQGDPLFPPSIIGQIDPATAQVIAADTLDLAQGRGWAFGFWGGAFYLFTAPTSSTHTVVTRFDPTDRSLVEEALLDGDMIVGAGVSTCAPSQ